MIPFQYINNVQWQSLGAARPSKAAVNSLSSDGNSLARRRPPPTPPTPSVRAKAKRRDVKEDRRFTRANGKAVAAIMRGQLRFENSNVKLHIAQNRTNECIKIAREL